MSKKSSRHHATHGNGDDQNDGPRWKRVHHSWIFWVGVVLVLVATLYYVLSIDLVTRPGVRPVQPTTSNVTAAH